MNEDDFTYPLRGLIPVGTEVKITYIGTGEDRAKIGDVGVVVDHDTYDDKRPYLVEIRALGGRSVWVNAELIEDKAVAGTIPAKTLTDFFTKHDSSAQFAVELLALLNDNNINVKWGN